MSSHNIKEILINEIDALNKELEDMSSSIELTNCVTAAISTAGSVALTLGISVGMSASTSAIIATSTASAMVAGVTALNVNVLIKGCNKRKTILKEDNGMRWCSTVK